MTSNDIFFEYSEYKSTEIEWVQSLPSHWESKPLFSLVKRQQIKNTGNKERNVLSLSYGNIVRRNIETNFGLLPSSFETYQIVKSGNIILRLTDLQNDKRSLRVGLVKEDGIITSAYICLHSLPVINNEYLFYLLHSYDLMKVFYSLGSGVRQSLTYDELKRLIIIIPPLKEQEVIVSFLKERKERIDKLIEKKQRLIELLQEKRQALITKAVTKGLDPNVPMKDSGIPWLGEVPEHWEIKRLGTETVVKARLGWKGLTASEYVDDGYVFLSTPNIKNFDIDFENVNYISEYRYLESPEIMLNCNDILLAKDGSTLGIVNVVRSLPRPATVNSSIAVIKPKSHVNGIYLQYFLKSNYIQHVIQQYKDGMGVPHLFQRDINKFHILTPPIQEQIKIAIFLDEKVRKTETIINKLQTQITKLQEYRQALITAAVTGKIDVREKVSS